MENVNKVVNQNQQPQPQKEDKKKNKFVAWWLGLNKWAKVGICAGTAAVLATAITLPIVLTKKDSGGNGGKYELELETASGFYKTKKFNIKSNYTYTFELSITTKKAHVFHIIKMEGQGHVSIKLKSASVEGSHYEWILDSNAEFRCKKRDTEQDTNLTFTVTADESANDVIAEVQEMNE